MTFRYTQQEFEMKNIFVLTLILNQWISFQAYAIEANSTWKSEVIQGQPLVEVLTDSQLGVELRYTNGTPLYSRFGEIQGFQTERYYSIKSSGLRLKNISTEKIKVYEVKGTNFELVEDLNLNYLKLLEVQNYNEVNYVQKIYRQSH
jgi:hypothetical protein